MAGTHQRAGRRHQPGAGGESCLAGAFAGAYASYVTGSPWLGVAAAAAVGMLVGALLGLFTMRWRANHVVAGIGLNIFVLGMTTWLLQVVWGSRGTSAR